MNEETIANPKTLNVMTCRVEDGLEVLSGKWKLKILMQIFKNPTVRFSVLQRAIPGITQKMLTKNLRELEAEDLIKRVVYPTVPPKVEYCLTEHGKELAPIFDQLHYFGLKHRAYLEQKNRGEE